GNQQWIALGGPGLDGVSESGIRFLGNGLTLESGTLMHLNAECGGHALPTIVFATRVMNGSGGGRTILIDDGTEMAAFTGAIRVAAPTAICGGDCNGDGRVTIDELLAAVDIALGRSSIDACTAIDADHDQHASIAEIVRAVVAILDGCG